MSANIIDFRLLDRLLRAPDEVITRCRSTHADDPSPSRGLRRMALTSCVTLAIAAAAFGACVGSWRGGAQIAYAAIKLPLAIFATLALSAPAFYVLAAIFGRAWSLRSVVALMLAAGARFALVLLALTPPLWLFIDLGAPYDTIKVTATLAYATAGLAGLNVLVRALGTGPGKHATITLFVGIFLLIGAQNAWVLRPYLGTPEARHVVFLTGAREGGLVVQLLKSARDLSSRSRLPDSE